MTTTVKETYVINIMAEDSCLISAVHHKPSQHFRSPSPRKRICESVRANVVNDRNEIIYRFQPFLSGTPTGEFIAAVISQFHHNNGFRDGTLNIPLKGKQCRSQMFILN